MQLTKGSYKSLFKKNGSSEVIQPGDYITIILFNQKLII